MENSFKPCGSFRCNHFDESKFEKNKLNVHGGALKRLQAPEMYVFNGQQ